MYAVGMTILLLGLIGPASTWAHDGSAHGHLTERQLRSAEARLLGADHAAEHALVRRSERRERARWRQVSPAQRQRELKQRRTARRRVMASAAAASSPETEGLWNGRLPIPVTGTHATVLPTGKVLWFARIDADDNDLNVAAAVLWDPSKPLGDPSALRRVDPPENLFCAGQSLMADGQVLVTGGNLAYATATPLEKGLNRIYTFDPWTEQWTAQPSMAHGRWYPTQTLLPDGRTLITSGRDETGAIGATNRDIELFNPPATRGGQGSVTKVGEYGALAGSPDVPALYPHWFVMPSGNILNAGPNQGESWVLGLAGTSVSSAGRPRWTRVHKAGTAVLLPGSPAGSTRVAQIGGYGLPGGSDASPASEVFDESRPTTAPEPGPSLNTARGHHNTVLLPDGSMVSIGGGYGARGGDLRLSGPEHLPAEVWDPATNTWRLGPAQAYKRAYHSTAVLLPDGRVISAGDDRDNRGDEFGPVGTRPPNKDPDRRADIAEIYEPAYLFKPGPRPAITAAPEGIRWDESFAVNTSSPITRAVLMAPGATTHANDMQQRHVELRITPNASGATLVAPPNANVAPPGYYMLFGLSASGKPSIAKWIRLGTASGGQSPGGQSPGENDTTADRTAPAFTIARISKKWRRVMRKGLRLVLVTNEPGTAKVKLTVNRAAARKLSLRRPPSGRVKVGGLKRTLPSGRSTLNVKLKSKARKAIKKAGKVKLRVAVVITDAAGNRASRQATVKLKR